MKKTIFITGATSGIGRITTEMLVKAGHTVYATGRNESALKYLESIGAIAFKADLRIPTDIDYVISKLPAIDVAILNAGLGYFESAVNLSDQEIDTMLDVNVRAPIHLTKRLAPVMIEKNSGHFIFVGSQAGKVATTKASVYAASKHAITGFVNGLRLELSDHNIFVTGIYPGPIDTPFLQKADASNVYRDAIEKFLIQPEKVAFEIVRAIEKKPREVNLPRIMGVTSKLYAVAPVLVELLGKGFFNKK
ncbi:SDR family NAD(P)-dependent oxidoreductase [Solibacillus merdavium]|uniref:SDR family NAD(P)-dependent oxidoreductase n=1 Tax=Solibacillus merdavium TaxID=2762218 RepID=A0ABR8XLT5_9BACL|nr:SDR family NAD(P)-dependent oxidoreductase [Solibacillus merdavium]MBD8032901.1 SDR family NAD(P)-dependent oxidoreductase [Solibacillus merdavium]